MANERANPFEIDFSDFQPAERKKPELDEQALREAAQSIGFSSREAPKKLVERTTAPLLAAPAPAPVQAPMNGARRRHMTGRNVQFNTKVTQQTHEKAYELADRLSATHKVVLGEMLERAFAALERELDQQE